MKSMRSAIIVSAIIFLAVSQAAAWGPEGKGRGSKPKEDIFKELNLSPEQQQKLQENRRAQREKAMQLRKAVKEKREELSRGLESATVTRAAVDPLVSEIKSLDAQLVDNRINGIFAVKEIMTPEQFAQFNQITKKRTEGMRERFKGWGGKQRGAIDDRGL